MFLVTGANGFIGSAMVWELNQAGHTDIVCVDTVSLEERPEPLASLKYKIFLSHQELLDRRDEFKELAAIFHMGACSSTTECDEEFLKNNNTLYTQKLFEHCTENKIAYIYASSAAVYGDGQQGFDDYKNSETYQPLNLYGHSKHKFDVWAIKQTHTPPRWYGLRFFNVYGPNEYHKESMASVVFKAFHQISQNSDLKLFRSHHPDYKDGEQMRDFVYIKDITRWMLEIYNNENIKSDIYNFGYGQARTWLDLATAVFENLDQPVNIDWIDIPENIRNQYQYFTEARIDKLKSQDISPPQWSLERGIKDYISNYLKPRDIYLK